MKKKTFGEKSKLIIATIDIYDKEASNDEKNQKCHQFVISFDNYCLGALSQLHLSLFSGNIPRL